MGSMQDLYVSGCDHLKHLISTHKWDDLWDTARARTNSKYNRLFVHYNGGEAKHFESEYVCKLLSEQVPMVEQDRAAQLDSTYNAFNGLLLEIRCRKIFNHVAAEGKSVTVTKTRWLGVPSETFHIAKIVDYSEAQSGGPAHLEFSTLCHIPVKRSQGCFDFVLQRRNKSGKYHVYFLKFTVANHDDALLQYAAEFLHRMFPSNLAKQVGTSAHKAHISATADAVHIGEDVPLLKHAVARAEALPASADMHVDDTESLAKLRLSADDSPVPVVSTEVFPKMKVQLHFYFVLPKDRVNKFKLQACNIEDIQSVQNL